MSNNFWSLEIYTLEILLEIRQLGELVIPTRSVGDSVLFVERSSELVLCGLPNPPKFFE
jgi:hypothetical protein